MLGPHQFRSRSVPIVPTTARRAVMTHRAAPSAARSAIAGRPPPGCSASKRRATGPTSAAPTSAIARCRRSPTAPEIDAFGLFTGQVGYAWNNVLLYVKGGAAVDQRQVRRLHDRDRRRRRHRSSRNPLGRRRSASASNIGFTPNWSVGVEYNHLFMGDRDLTFDRRCAGGASSRDRPHPPGRRHGHRPHQLPLGRPGRRAGTELRDPRSELRKAGLAPAFFVCGMAPLRLLTAAANDNRLQNKPLMIRAQHWKSRAVLPTFRAFTHRRPIPVFPAMRARTLARLRAPGNADMDEVLRAKRQNERRLRARARSRSAARASTTSRTSTSRSRATSSWCSPACPAPANPRSPSTPSMPRASAATSNRCRPMRASSWR